MTLSAPTITTASGGTALAGLLVALGPTILLVVGGAAVLLAAAVGAGHEVLNAPRDWPEYHPGCYAGFLRDLDGHDVEAVTHG